MVKKLVKSEIKLLTDSGNHDTFEMIKDENSLAHATADPKMVCCEVYNGNKFDIIFQSQKQENIGTKYFNIKCKADDFCFLPHQYYFCRGIEKNGTLMPSHVLIDVILNFGESKFKGIKKASVPSNTIQ